MKNKSETLVYYEIRNPQLVEEAVSFYSQITNRLIMKSNILHKKISVNDSGFGKDTVYKNLDYLNPIIIN